MGWLYMGTSWAENLNLCWLMLAVLIRIFGRVRGSRDFGLG